MKITDVTVQENAPEYDRDILHRKVFSVNIRLVKSNQQYRSMIKHMIDHMLWIIDQEWEDYDGLNGVAAANLGIPFNIVVIKVGQEKKVMVNPEIYEKSDFKISCWTNNASIRAKEKLHVHRHEWVSVRYFDFPECNLHFLEKIQRQNGALILQHEIDSNNGITIVDRHLKSFHSPCGWE